VFSDPLKNIYVPVLAGEYTEAECNGRNIYTINGKEYDECSFCRASCPSRDLFKEPDSGLPLKCDMCEERSPEEKEPLCVQWCINDALTYEEREEEGEEEPKLKEMEVGLESLVKKYGAKTVRETLARVAKGQKLG
jgi:benzoyl-CoA reductase subunit BamC